MHRSQFDVVCKMYVALNGHVHSHSPVPSKLWP
jgi:hypothetical protein